MKIVYQNRNKDYPGLIGAWERTLMLRLQLPDKSGSNAKSDWSVVTRINADWHLEK